MRARGRFSHDQCRAARGLLGWSQEDLAARSRLPGWRLSEFEAGTDELDPDESAALGCALNDAGVIAIAERRGGEGVRFSRPRGPP